MIGFFFGDGIGLVMYGTVLKSKELGQFIDGIFMLVTYAITGIVASTSSKNDRIAIKKPCIKKPRFLGVLFLSKRIL